MNTKEYELLRNLLIEQKSSLLNRSQSFRDDEMSTTQLVGDEADHATSELSLNMNLRLFERERYLVQKIDNALAKLESGSYGNCEECEEPMSFKRLWARPVANLCISCKEDQEERERTFA
jgi:DnaK suppressor protein